MAVGMRSEWKDDYFRTHSNVSEPLLWVQRSPRFREHKNECEKWSSACRLGWQGDLGVQVGMEGPGRTVGRVQRRGRRMGV